MMLFKYDVHSAHLCYIDIHACYSWYFAIIHACYSSYIGIIYILGTLELLYVCYSWTLAFTSNWKPIQRLL